jgi:bacterial leucyl aminopeptidase
LVFCRRSGLLGSQNVPVNYKKTGKKVKAFLQLDMTAYFSGNEVIALESVSASVLVVFIVCDCVSQDYVDGGLNTFVKSLIDTYTRFHWAMDKPVSYD